MTPTDRQYTTTHEWVKLEGQTATIGITDHAQHALGDITYVDLPAAGRALAAGTEFGVIESVKAASDLFAPVSGQVQEVNSALAATPELVNSSPYGDGWLIRVKCTDARLPAGLLDAAAYDAQHAPPA